MATDGNRQFYADLAEKNLNQATAEENMLRGIKNATGGYSKADVDGHERAAKDAITRAADAVRTLVEVGD